MITAAAAAAALEGVLCTYISYYNESVCDIDIDDIDIDDCFTPLLLY